MKQARTSGMALLSILMIVGVLSALIVIFMGRLEKAQQRTQSLRLKGELMQVRAHMKTRIDCGRIPNNPQCRLGGLPQSSCGPRRIELFTPSGTKIVDDGAQGSLVAPGLRLRACCDAGNLRLEAKRTDAAGNAKKDPFIETISYNWVDVYETEASPCDYYDKTTGNLATPEGIAIATADALPSVGTLALFAGVMAECPGYKGELGGMPEYYVEGVGEAKCPDGYMALTGGASCQNMALLPYYPSWAHLHQSGFQKSSSATIDGQSWRSSCCIAVNAIPLQLLPDFFGLYVDAVRTVCVRRS
jgi:hypothetical protein